MFDIKDSESERIYIIKCESAVFNLKLFEESVDEFIKNDSRDMVIDLKEETVINSLLLASLIRIRNGLSQKHRELSLKNCNSQMYRCIELAGLETFFSFSNYEFE